MELSRGDVAPGAPAPTPSSVPLQEDVPVFVMLPLDTINADGVFRYASSKWFNAALQDLKDTGIHGVAVDVWVRVAAAKWTDFSA